MSHEAVQAVIERTLVDEGFRNQLLTQPESALSEYELTGDERAALQSLSVETESEVANTAALQDRRSKAPLWTLGL